LGWGWVWVGVGVGGVSRGQRTGGLVRLVLVFSWIGLRGACLFSRFGERGWIAVRLRRPGGSGRRAGPPRRGVWRGAKQCQTTPPEKQRGARRNSWPRPRPSLKCCLIGLLLLGKAASGGVGFFKRGLGRGGVELSAPPRRKTPKGPWVWGGNGNQTGQRWTSVDPLAGIQQGCELHHRKASPQCS
jgi:hypothetical protein